jgi:rubrerythrin
LHWRVGKIYVYGGSQKGDCRRNAMPDQLTKILKGAVHVEEESFKLYTIAQEKAKLASSKSFLKELAETELEHKRKLIEVINDKMQVQSIGSQRGELQDLGIVDYMKDITRLSEDPDYQEILTYAAQREKRTHDYYLLLAKKFQRTRVGDLFQKLAEEELEHKIKIEKEYDENLLKEN